MTRLLIQVIGCAAALACCLHGQEQHKIRLYRVNDTIYRGRQPDRQEIPQLASAGIHTVLDLRGALDHKSWEKAAVKTAGMQYVRIGLSGVFPPTQHQLNRILAVLEDPTAGPVYIHCRRGADRSGLVIACYRIAHDHWTNAQAMKEAREQGLSRLEILMQRYIRHFHAAAQPAQDGKGATNVPGLDHKLQISDD